MLRACEAQRVINIQLSEKYSIGNPIIGLRPLVEFNKLVSKVKMKSLSASFLPKGWDHLRSPPGARLRNSFRYSLRYSRRQPTITSGRSMDLKRTRSLHGVN
jgi:hypothetical protein